LRRAYRLKQTAELPEQLKETWNGQLEEINGDLSTQIWCENREKYGETPDIIGENQLEKK